MDPKRIHTLESDPVLKAMIKLALPTVLGMIVQILYNIIDTFFIGKLNDPSHLAAVSLAMPLFMLLMSLGGILGVGGASYLSRVMGEKDFKTAGKTGAVAFYSCLVLGAAVTAISMVFLDEIVIMLGTSRYTFQYAYDYSRVIFLGCIIIIANFVLSQLLRAEGAAKEAMLGMVIGTAVNVVLDPLFIFTFNMGVVGAAVATILGNLTAFAYYIFIYQKNKGVVSLSFSRYSFDPAIYYHILVIGVPASLNQILMSVANILCNNIAASYGDITVAAVGIAVRIIMIPIFILVGLSVGCQPLIGFSYGASNFPRLKETVGKAILIGTIIGLFFGALFWFFTRQFIAAFSTDVSVVEAGVVILRALTLSMPFVAVQIIITGAMQAMGKVLPSLILFISRQGIFYIPALIILNAIWGFFGFIYSQAVTDVLVMFLSLVLFVGILPELAAAGNTSGTPVSVLACREELP